MSSNTHKFSRPPSLSIGPPAGKWLKRTACAADARWNRIFVGDSKGSCREPTLASLGSFPARGREAAARSFTRVRFDLQCEVTRFFAGVDVAYERVAKISHAATWYLVLGNWILGYSLLSADDCEIGLCMTLLTADLVENTGFSAGAVKATEGYVNSSGSAAAFRPA